MLSITAHYKGEWIDEIAPEDLGRWIDRPEALLWIDMEGPSDEELSLLTDKFVFHPLAVEDVHNSHQRPKIDLYKDHAFLVFYAVSYDESRAAVRVEELALFVGSSYVVTIHRAPIAELEELHERWANNSSRIGHDIVILLYSLLDAVLDNYFPVLDWIAARLDELEEATFTRLEPGLIQQFLHVKHNLLTLRRVAGPQRDVVNVLLRGEHGILPDSALPYLQDLYDHSLRIVEGVDMYREMSTTITDGFLSAQSNNISEVMRRLTIINLLFLPLAVLTGFFGMNFEMLPFQSFPVLLLALGAMVALPTGMYFWLRGRGWG